MSLTVNRFAGQPDVEKLRNPFLQNLEIREPNAGECPSINAIGALASFQFRNVQFLARSRKLRGWAEAYTLNDFLSDNDAKNALIDETSRHL